MLNRFLDQLVQEIKVDLRNEEIQDVRSAVFELVSRILQQLERKLPFFESKSTKFSISAASLGPIYYIFSVLRVRPEGFAP